MKSWIKGGIWGLIIGLIVVPIVIGFLLSLAFGGGNLIELLNPVSLFAFYKELIFSGSNGQITANTNIYFIIFILFLSGALIGWIVEKIKSRKQNVENAK